MLRILTVLILLVFSSEGSAQTIGLHLASVHSHHGYNNTNPGLYVRLNNGATAGVYRNSVSKTSGYLAYSAESSYGPLSAAVTVGMVSGYRRSLMPLVVPSAAYNFDGGAVRLAAIPKPPSGGGAAAMHLMIERHF